jgi:SNF2 family DNA or RNA helicase
MNGWKPSPYLMQHQLEAARIALEHPRFGFFDDTGVGKTVSAIEIIKQKKVRTLVVCKLSLIENAWMKDLKTFAPELSAVNLWEAFKKRGRIFPHQVGIINFESFKNQVDHLKDYQMVIVDESSAIKDHRARITKALIAHTDRVPFVCLLSGTPAPNNELEYWSQFRIIDPSLLGRSYYSFRNSFCYSCGYGGFSWKLKNSRKGEFLDLISRKSRAVRKEDVLDLPERTDNIRTVYLDNRETAAYRDMEARMVLEIGGRESIAANSAVKILKLRQGTSGFFYDTEQKPMVTGRSKLETLRQLLEEIGNHQVIIWTSFHEEADQISKMLSHDFVRVDGTESNQDRKNEAVRAFANKKARYLISHPASLGHGVTLHNCSRVIYYSLDYSFERFYQSRDRIYRKGQVNHCSYYYLIAKGTVDEIILKALERKEDVANAVLAYLKTKRKGD